MEYMAVHTVMVQLIADKAVNDKLVKTAVLDTDLQEDFNRKLEQRLREEHSYDWLNFKVIQIETKLVERPSRFEQLGLDTWKMTG